MKNCPNCEKKSHDEYSRCGYCGQLLDGASPMWVGEAEALKASFGRWVFENRLAIRAYMDSYVPVLQPKDVVADSKD